MTSVLVGDAFAGVALAGAQLPSATPSADGAQANNTTPATASVPVATSVPSGNQVTPSPDIIPRLGSGQEPRDPGDRGGWWQETLFFLMCGAVLLIGGLVWRDSRRARRRQGRLGPRPTNPLTSAAPEERSGTQDEQRTPNAAGS